MLVVGLSAIERRAEAAASQRTVTIAWDPSPDTNVTDYVVRYGTRTRVYSKSFRSGGRTIATLGALQDGLGYFITVAAVNRLGLESEPSEEIQYADPCAARVVSLTVEHSRGAANGPRLMFPTVAGQKYQIESSVDLQTWTPDWVTPVTAGRSVLEFTDPRTETGPWRFYRTVMVGPFYESSSPITLTPVASPDTGIRVGFSTERGRAYELQSSDNGQVWSTTWSTMNAAEGGWVEQLDRESTPRRRYRLLMSAKDAGQGSPCNDTTEFAPIISDPPQQFTWMDVPTDAIALLVADADTPLQQLQFSFTSSDPALVPPANVRISGQGGQRSVVVTPGRGQAGKAVIDIVVSDGIRSAATAVEIEVLPFTPTVFPIKVETTIGGKVSPGLDGHVLRIGKRYTATAKPDPGYVFVGWSGDIESSSRTISFTMRPRMALEAIFVANPFAAIKGTYAGLFREQDALGPNHAGRFTVSVTEGGKYSGKLLLGGRSYSFAGQLNTDRSATNTIPRKSTTPVTLALSFSGDSDRVSGRVTDGLLEAPLLGYRNSFEPKASPAPFAGAYTVILQGQEDPNRGAEGHGFGIAKVDGYGRASFAGTLADGTKVSQKVALSKDGQWPLHASLHGGAGAVHGWLTITNQTANDVRGALGWIKPALPKSRLYPAGFTNEVIALGSRYVRPATSISPILGVAQAPVVFSGGNLPSSITNAITIDERNRIGNLSGNKLSMTLSSSSGLFKGSVTHPLTGKSATFNGAVLQNRNGGAGFLAGTNRSARVTFGF